ncbi:MAG: hypothetical protein GXP43_03175 [bacterium]|nr:hypothetical protein [bacterium]
MAENRLLDEVWVINVEKTLYRGKAVAISSVNQKGRFDVLALHSNFISLIYQSLRIVLPDGKVKSFKFNVGVLRVKNNRAEVILE